MNPLVSIVTPSFNQGRFIEETIQSVLSQDYSSLEYLVMDGGSTDNTLDVLRRYESRLRWVSEPDRGQSHAINKGFARARGEIVAWLNSDDTFVQGAVNKAVRHFQKNPDVMMVYGEGYLIDEQSQVKQRFPATEPFNLWRLIYYGDYILQQTVFMRKEVFDQVGMLDESLHYGMDWDLWIRIGKRFRIDYIPEFLGNLREYSAAKTFSGGLARFEELVRIMRRHGTRRYPPALFNYGWEPYQEAVVGTLRKRFPWAEWGWLARGAGYAGKIARYLLFRQLLRLSQPSPYPDGWLSDHANFLFADCGGKSKLRVLGSTKNVPATSLPMKIKTRVNGQTLEPWKITRAEEFELEHRLPTGSLQDTSMLEVTLSTNKFFVPSRFGVEDHRRLAFELIGITLI
ncbi:MAG: glycosyltransferase family 2 protein [Acidobacteriota bacterium]